MRFCISTIYCTVHRCRKHVASIFTCTRRDLQANIFSRQISMFLIFKLPDLHISVTIFISSTALRENHLLQEEIASEFMYLSKTSCMHRNKNNGTTAENRCMFLHSSAFVFSLRTANSFLHEPHTPMQITHFSPNISGRVGTARTVRCNHMADTAEHSVHCLLPAVHRQHIWHSWIRLHRWHR